MSFNVPLDARSQLVLAICQVDISIASRATHKRLFASRGLTWTPCLHLLLVAQIEHSNSRLFSACPAGKNGRDVLRFPISMVIGPVYAGRWLERIRAKDGHHLAMVIREAERVILLVIRRQRRRRTACLHDAPGELHKCRTNLVEAFGAARSPPCTFQKLHHIVQELYVLHACRCNCMQENDNEWCERRTVKDPGKITGQVSSLAHRERL